MKRIGTLFIVIFLFLAMTIAYGAESDQFGDMLQQCVHVRESLADDIHPAAHLYQCATLLSMPYPDMSMEELHYYLEIANLPEHTVVEEIEGDTVTIFPFSNIYHVRVYGNPITAAELLIYYHAEQSPLVCPIDINLTVHSEVKNHPLFATRPVENTLSANKYANLQQSVMSEYIPDNTDDGVLELVQYVLFSSQLRVGITKEECLAFAKNFPMLSKENCTDAANQLVWNIENQHIGKLTIFCSYEAGRLTKVGFSVDPRVLSNLCLPYLLFDYPDNFSGRIEMYYPIVYSVLAD